MPYSLLKPDIESSPSSLPQELEELQELDELLDELLDKLGDQAGGHEDICGRGVAAVDNRRSPLIEARLMAAVRSYSCVPCGRNI